MLHDVHVWAPSLSCADGKLLSSQRQKGCVNATWLDMLPGSVQLGEGTCAGVSCACGAWCHPPPWTSPLWLHSVSLLAPHPGQPGAHMLWRTLPCPCFVRLTVNNRSDNTRPPFTKTVPTTRPCLCNLDSKGVWNSHTFQHPCRPLLFPTTKAVTSTTHLLPPSNCWTLAEHGAA